MAQLEIDGEELVLRLSKRERWGGLHREIRVPVSSVVEVREVPAATKALRGFRAPGTGLPGVIALGTWRRRGGKDFVAAYRRHPGVIVRLDGQKFDRLVVSGEIPADVLALGEPSRLN